MALKSAYELAMERLTKKGGPERKVTEAQKKQLAETDSFYKSKIAELEIAIAGQLAAAREAQKAEEFIKLQERLVSERQKLRDQCEAKKEKLRKSSAS